MARFPFGGTLADWTFSIATVDGVGNLAQLVGGIPVTFWTAEVGGIQHTDLIGPDGQATTTVTSAAGAVGGRALGQLPPFAGPDGVKAMWAQAGTGPRALMTTTDPGGGDDLGIILPPLSVPGTATAPAIGKARLYNDTTATLQVAAVRASVGTPPSAATIIDVNRNGVSIFSTPVNRPTIEAGRYTSGKITPLDTVTIAPDDYLTADIVTGAGWSHLVVQILATRAT